MPRKPKRLPPPRSPWLTIITDKDPDAGLMKDVTGTVMCVTYPDGKKVYKYNLPGMTNDVTSN